MEWKIRICLVFTIFVLFFISLWIPSREYLPRMKKILKRKHKMNTSKSEITAIGTMASTASLDGELGLAEDRFHRETLSYLSSFPLFCGNNSGCEFVHGGSKKTFAIVTALSSNHFTEFKKGFLPPYLKHLSSTTIIIYDIGLSKNERKYILETLCKMKDCPVKIKTFLFEAYPKYVKVLKQYRWKPIIIAKELYNYQMLLWADTSSTFMCPKSEFFQLLDSETKSSGGPCDDVITILPSSHSIYATTHPTMLRYLPLNTGSLLKVEFGAGLIIYKRTAATANVMKWWVLCALEQECMAPEGAQLPCYFNEDRFNNYARCHRYDQAALNIILRKKCPDGSFYKNRIRACLGIKR